MKTNTLIYVGFLFVVSCTTVKYKGAGDSSKNEAFGMPILSPTIGHSRIIESVSFSPDGKYILSGSHDFTAILWDINGNQIRIFRGHTDKIHSVAFSPDGKFVLTATGDETILWDAIGNQIRSFKGLGFISDVAFSPDGTRFLIVANRTVILWDVNGNRIANFEHSEDVYSAKFSRSGNYIVAGGSDKMATLWSITGTGKEIRTFKGHTDSVSMVSFAQEDKYIVTVSGDSSAKIWDVNGTLLRTLKGHSASITSVSISPDGKSILTGSFDKTVKLWGISGNLIKTIEQKGRVGSVAFSPDGKSFIGTSEEKLILHNVDGTVLRNFASSSVLQSLSVLSPNGQYILITSNNMVRLIDIVSNSIKSTFKHLSTIWSVSFSPDGKYILTGSDDKTATLWDLSGNQIHTFKGHTKAITSVAFSPDGKLFLTGSNDEMAILWNLSGNRVTTFKHPSTIWSVSFSPDGKHILTGGSGNTAILWDTNGTQIQTFKGHTSSISSLTFSPDGKFVLTGSYDKTAILWDLYGNQVNTFQNPYFSFVRSVAFSPNGKFVFMGDYNNTIIWDINGKQVGDYFERFEGVSLNGFFLLHVRNFNGSVLIRSLAEEKWISLVCNEHGFIVAANDSRFDYSDEKIKNYFNFHKGGTNEPMSLDIIFDHFYTPGLLAQFFGKEGEHKKPKEKIEDLFKNSPPPQVTVSSFAKDGTFEQSISVTVKACDNGGGVEDIRLYHNNSSISLEETRGINIKSDGKCKSKSFMISLVSGLNEFKGSAKSKEGLEGFSDLLGIKFKVTEIKKPTQHVVIIAINEYRNPKFKLKYAVNDANAFKEKIIERGKSLFASTQVYEALDKQATREGIKSAFAKAAANSKPEDVAVIFFAGHGFSEDRKYYYIQQDNPANSEDAIKQGISQDELTTMISSIRALKKLVVLDTCQAGGDWLVALRGADEQAALGILAKSAGVWVIAASQEQQYALETSKTGHGLLTSSLLEGFDGKAKKGDKFVKPSGLIGWVNERVPSLAQELFKREQFPYTAQRGQDFPIGE